MNNEFEDNIFGVDMRHKPPLTILPTQEKGWESSRGRLAYSQMNRAQERNYSEYALDTMGIMPKNYIIVNQAEVKVNKETAIKVCHGRVAIPVKEFARQKRLSLKEQWELMNPQWIGTFFGNRGDDPYRNRRPSLEQAMNDAMAQDKFDEFMQQFWSAEYGHKSAIERLEKRVKNLMSTLRFYDKERFSLRKTIANVVDKVNKGQLQDFHLQGLNAHEYLIQMKNRLYELNGLCMEVETKAKRIKDYINSITY